MSAVVGRVSPSEYLRSILRREAVEEDASSNLRALEGKVDRLCGNWGGRHLLEVYPTGAFEKRMANKSGVNIDFLLSLSPETPFRIAEIYESLAGALKRQGFSPIRRPVSLGINLDGTEIDLIPAKREALSSDVHELHSTSSGFSTKTNLTQHVLDALENSRHEEVRVLKLWRDQNGLDLPSFYLELTSYAALRRRPLGELADNVWMVLGYLESLFVARGVLDPANANNVVSSELTTVAKKRVAQAAAAARAGRPWSEIVR
ncbi:hypothetical protein [Devosia sp.]|uniref:hypothetical protein n=1 Tax=Devosia sp. TaxID=1871048 RepID=UPI003BAB3F48